ncbi:hypothetical protein IWW35_001076 [Coemansia sp. RSA 1878]|nr:hypothetical protein IWW35_001076 [Coemansia sp. RSA 1878]
MSETNKRITDALTGSATASDSPSTNDIMEMLVKMLHSQTTGFDKLMKVSEEQNAALKEQNAMLKEQRTILNRIAEGQDRMMLHITNSPRPVVAGPSSRNMQAGGVFDCERS